MLLAVTRSGWRSDVDGYKKAEMAGRESSSPGLFRAGKQVVLFELAGIIDSPFFFPVAFVLASLTQFFPGTG